MIIDCHIHLDDYSEKQHTLKEKIDNLIEEMDKNKISKALIMDSKHSPEWGPEFPEILRTLKEKNLLNKRLYIIGSIKSNYKKKDLERLEYELKKKLVVAVKLYPGYENFYPFEKRFQRIYELCIKYDIPCFFHSGSTFSKKANIKTAHPIHIENVALKNPKLKIVICHIAMPWYQTCVALLERHENVFTDISGFLVSPNKETFEIFKNTFKFIKGYVGNYDKILFGTDWSLCNYEDYLRFIETLKLGKEDLDKILHKNIKKLINL